MATLRRASFRQLLLVAFLLIAGFLAAASLGGLYTLDRLMDESRDASERGVQLNAATQQLAERSLTMERAARQFMVLEDPQLLRGYREAAAEATTIFEEVLAEKLDPSLAARWRRHLSDIGVQLAGPKQTRRQREQAMAAQFAELNRINATIAETVRRQSEDRNRYLQSALATRRSWLAQQMVVALALAVVLALVFGYWLTRPLKRLERAIVGLGENRLDQPVEIDGPGDLALLGQRLEWLRTRLNELDEDRARFLRHVSHELKTPLAALREGVALLEDGVAGVLTPDQREVARILGHNAAVLQGQIEQLLRFNTAAFEARRLSRRPVDLQALMRAQVDAQRLQWQARRLRVRVQGGPLVVSADPEKLGTALGNLLSNAIRFSPEGGSIEIGIERRPGLACLSIRDEGPGIAAADRERVFEPFYRGLRQPEGALHGTGIGLSLVRHNIEAHGGHVQLLPAGGGEGEGAGDLAGARAGVGTGAHFRIELPHEAGA
jgi:two-component system, NtrC family, sensor histidine kinase GlrK